MTAQKKKGQSSTCCRDRGTMEWKVEKAEEEGSCKVRCSNCKWKTSYFTVVTPGLPYRKGLGTKLVSRGISDEHRYMEAPNNKFPSLPGGGDINTACQPFTKFITTSCCHALSSHPDLQPLWESKTSLIPSKSGCEFGSQTLHYIYKAQGLIWWLALERVCMWTGICCLFSCL